MMRYRRALPLLGLLLAACGDATGPTWFEWTVNHRKWELAGPADYTYEFQRGCFCLPAAVQRVRITVHDGGVQSVVSLATGDPIPPADVDDYFRITIDSLFGLVAAAHRDADEVRVTFDPILGYPKEIFIDYYFNAADDEMWFSAASVTR